MIRLNLTYAIPDGITPRLWQLQALDALSKSDCPAPIVHAVMGAGKSILVVMLIRAALAGGAKRICVAVPTEALVEQIYQDLACYVGKNTVGRFYGKLKESINNVVITCFPSIESMHEEYGGPWDLLIVDECHLSESATLKSAVSRLEPKWRIGLSATPYRSDDDALSLWESVAYSYGIGQALEDKVLVPWDIVQPLTGGLDCDDWCISQLKATNPDGPGIIGARSIADAELFAEQISAEYQPARPIHSGMSSKLKQAAFQDLQSGAIKALVHVDILTTGVNLPWLRWLMMRRKYASRTAFLQFFGRGLRASEGKDSVLIFDPWEQLESFSLEYAANIGKDNPKHRDKELQIPEDEIAFDLIDLPPYNPEWTLPRKTCKRAISAWCRALLHGAQAAKVCAPSPWNSDGEWRKKPASDKQVLALRNLAWTTRHLPADVARNGVKAILEVPGHITCGAATDLMSVLLASAEGGKVARSRRMHWNWHLITPLPALPKRVVESIKVQ